ncbi:MAG: flavin reductase family protein [Synergistaceae bacterium]|nr:flavin reductase family protein [Synergistaceae bacterium]
MEKINIGNNVFLLPMPMVLVGSRIKGRPNFMAVAWVSRVNASPNVMCVAIGNKFTAEGILENKEFSINIPSVDLMPQTDLMGIVSGRDYDKSKEFDIFYGALKNAPMICECPVMMECRLVKSVRLEVDTLFMGEVMNVWSEEKYLTNGAPDITKVSPFCLSMPDNRYWSLGKEIGKAWHEGMKLKDKLQKI